MHRAFESKIWSIIISPIGSAAPGSSVGEAVNPKEVRVQRVKCRHTDILLPYIVIIIPYYIMVGPTMIIIYQHHHVIA